MRGLQGKPCFPDADERGGKRPRRGNPKGGNKEEGDPPRGPGGRERPRAGPRGIRMTGTAADEMKRAQPRARGEEREDRARKPGFFGGGGFSGKKPPSRGKRGGGLGPGPRGGTGRQKNPGRGEGGGQGRPKPRGVVEVGGRATMPGGPAPGRCTGRAGAPRDVTGGKGGGRGAENPASGGGGDFGMGGGRSREGGGDPAPPKGKRGATRPREKWRAPKTQLGSPPKGRAAGRGWGRPGGGDPPPKDGQFFGSEAPKKEKRGAFWGGGTTFSGGV